MRLERQLVLAAALILLARGGASQDEPRWKPSFSIALSADRMEFKADGSPTPLKLAMSNTSDLDLRFDVLVKRCKHLDYVPVTVRQVDVQLYDSDGNPVPLTLYGKAVRGRAGECFGRGAQGVLKPGDSLAEEVDINKEFEIKKPGRYTVQAQRLDKDGKAMVKSEAVTVTLTAAQ